MIVIIISYVFEEVTHLLTVLTIKPNWCICSMRLLTSKTAELCGEQLVPCLTALYFHQTTHQFLSVQDG